MNCFSAKFIQKVEEPDTHRELATYLADALRKHQGKPVTVLCIGSDMYTGDSLGPIIGSILKDKGVEDWHILGTLDAPVHGGNLCEAIKSIPSGHAIIAIDACLGRPSEVGNIECWRGGIEPGIAVGNRLPVIGDMAITGVVNAGGQLGYLDIQATPLGRVMKLAKAIANAVIAAKAATA